MRKPLIIIAALVLGASLSAHAQSGGVRYKWHDNQGLVHFSDSLTAEAMKYGYELVNDRGLVVQRVARQLNAQERAAANKLAAEQAAKDRVIQDRANADAQMLSAYPDEESYQISLQQALGTYDQQINTTRINLRSQEKALTDLLGRAADLENAKEAVPKSLADSIAKQRNVVAAQRDTLQRQQAFRAQSVQQQAQAMAHYRVVKAAHDKQQTGE
ncbi:small-conductance mechanosensitive channel [Rhodanobacter sp. TND4EL1]